VPQGKLSVIIPTRDSQVCALECVRTLISQTLQPAETVVVDCGSRDSTREIVEESYPEARILRLRRRSNLSQALNRGIRETSAPLVSFLFPEVKLEKGYFSKLVDALEHPEHAETGFATGKIFKMFRGNDVLDSTGLVWPDASPLPLKRGEGEHPGDRYEMQGDVIGPSRGAAVYRRALLQDVALFGEVFDESLDHVLEDVDVACRAHLFGWKGLYVPEARATYDVRDEGPGPTYPDAFRWAFGRQVVLLKNAPLSRLFRGLSRGVIPGPLSLLRDPGSSVPALFAFTGVLSKLHTIRCKRQEIRKRARMRSKAFGISGT